MDAHVSLEALEKFKHLLTQFSKNMSIEAQKMQLHLKKTYEQLQQKYFELKRQLQMCQDPVSHERAKQQLAEFERLFAGFCQAAQECIKGFQQQELMAANRQKSVATIDRKVGVLREYLGTGSGEHGKNQMSHEVVRPKEENAVPYKQGGGRNPKDFANIHARKHMYDPSKTSTRNRSQYGEDVDVGKLREETMSNPDKAYSNWPNPNNPNTQRITKYYKEFNGNISTPDTPTGSHRVFENLDKPSKSSHFPYVRRK